MYRRPKFLEVLLDIRREMAHESDYDTDLFAEMVRAGRRSTVDKPHSLAYDDATPTNGKVKDLAKKKK